MAISIGGGYELDWSIVRETVLGVGDEEALVMDANRRLFRRWVSAGHGEWMVPRDAFDIVEFGDLVGSLCVYDRDEAGDDYLCRVFGSAIVADLGIEMTGRRISSYPENLRQTVRRGYDRALASRAPFASVHLVVRNQTTGTYPREDGRFLREKLILPVTRSGRGIDCFITHVARMPADALGSLGTSMAALPNGVA